MKRAVIKISFFFVMLITTASIATPTHWQTVLPGLEYTQISMLSGFHTGHLHAFRVDLTRFKLALAIAEDQQNQIASVADLTKVNHGILGINGGFFSQELKPLGLRISNHVQRHPLKSTPWWGVFYVLNSQPHIESLRTFKLNPNISFAVQSGPRLIVNGKVPITLKPGIDSRTAIGVTDDNKVILTVTQDLTLTTTQLAQLMLASQINGGLACKNAMNLDGGSSTQLYANFGKFFLEVVGYSAVTDAILVLPRDP